jgi:arabinogalactan oligomer/maltooligosaccharide transport system permease protein
MTRRWFAFVATLAWLFVAACHRGGDIDARRGHVMVWHAYRGEEQTALAQVIDAARRANPDLVIDSLAIPFDAYASKLESAIPHGHGPDVFIDAHERLASYIDRGLVSPLDGAIASSRASFEPLALQAVERAGHTYAFPLSVKCVALYLDTTRIDHAPDTLEEIIALRASLPQSVYPLVYYAQNAYFHAPLAHAFGAEFIDPVTGAYRFVGPEAEASIAEVRRMIRERIIPDEADAALVSQLFANGRAAAAISGPWLAADLGPGVHYRVAPLPRLARTGRPMVPFATVEGAYLSSHAHDREAALRFAAFLAGTEAARIRARVGRQVVANIEAWSDPALAHDTFLTTFREAARVAMPMPTHPNMRSAFEPANAAIRRAIRGDVPITVALEQSAHRFADATRSPPSPRDPIVAQLLLGALGLYLAFVAIQRGRDPQFRRDVARSWPAYRYVLHAAIIVMLIVVAPLVIGAATSFFAGREGAFHYVGIANYVDILRARGGPLLASGSFWLVLLVTLLWTVTNIALHVAIGVTLALLLARPVLRLRALYRVLLIIPWAVPSYVTALAWKGMFHRQLGAMNAILASLGAEPVAWFSRFSTAFAANVATNVWLGFPFMMVVTIGALAAIPNDLYEAAAVDGASAWQRFRLVTLPLLRPSLAPAIAMGAVWTFNMFNVIFLVSGGEPDGQTEILVTEAYRWAFTRQAQYGYAAAYAVLIFGILLVGTRVLDRLTQDASKRGVA